MSALSEYKDIFKRSEFSARGKIDRSHAHKGLQGLDCYTSSVAHNLIYTRETYRVLENGNASYRTSIILFRHNRAKIF